MRGYRRVVPDFARWQADLGADGRGPRSTARACWRALKAISPAQAMSADWSAIDDTPDERLITTLAMVCPFEPQREAGAARGRATPAERAATLIALMEMGAAAAATAPRSIDRAADMRHDEPAERRGKEPK